MQSVNSNKNVFDGKSKVSSCRERRTKIVSTLGPATDDPAVLEKLILAGVNVVRLNFSHGSHSEHKIRIETMRQASLEKDKNIAIIITHSR